MNIINRGILSMLKTFILPTVFLICVAVNGAYAADDDAMQKCQGKHPEWYQCVTDDDCTISQDPCGWPVLGVNKFHKERSEICTRQAGAFIDCPMWKDTPENKMTVKCQKGVCTGLKASEAPTSVQ